MALAAVTTTLASNPISVENALPGNPASEWEITGAGDPSIQGFATEISVNKGQTVRFKVNTNASAYRIDIYRLGYYQGLGARRVATITPSVTLPQIQPAPLSDSATGLVDCGNWAVSASWNVPANATSGVYIGKLVRTDTGGASHLVFIVRDDAGSADLLFQTSDTTWQAYNTYGGNSLYVGAPAGRAYKVSYNRPFITRQGGTSFDWLFSAEYPMIRWLEANGYHVSYFTGVDTDRRGTLLSNHRAFLSVGHDEYWSGAQRANVEAARNAGVHLAFFSGNAMFWKTRWEPSIDGSGTQYRTLVCYKETHANAKIDPSSEWTGTWRDPRFSPPSNGGRPENALMGTLFMINGNRSDALSVPASYGAHRFWRHTSVASLTGTQVATFANGTLGYEWDEAPQNGWQPPGLMRLSSTTVNGVPLLRDYGSTYSSGTGTHSLTLYRHSSGALVFGAGTVQWSWGLDAVHDNSSAPADVRIQQATVNLFADMGTIPATLRSGLTQATPSSDSVAPVSTIQTPASGVIVQAGTSVEITGTANDSGGKVWGVEVSVDGGVTWRPASGQGNWSFSWIPSVSGPVTIRSRSFDDSGNMESPSSGVAVTVDQPSFISIWPATAAPANPDGGPNNPVELGVKFRSDVAGVITGIRFYKAAANTGTHVGSLWSSTGTRLAWATFTGESASGWQHVTFSTPVTITANTVYVASYHCLAGHYSVDANYFATSGVDNPPLRALASGISGGNGVYRYGPAGTFPNQAWNSANYWVDVMFEPTLNSIAVTPANPSILSGSTQLFTATGSYADGSTRNITSRVTWTSSNTSVATIGSGGVATAGGAGTTTIRAASGNVSGTSSLTVTVQPLAITTASLPGGSINEAYSATLTASGGTLPRAWSVSSGSLPPGLTLNAGSGAISGTPGASGTFNFTVQVSDASTPSQTVTKALSIAVTTPPPAFYSIWPATAAPTKVDEGADSPVEIGVKFRSDVAGIITGIRFYKAATNTGTHVGSLWSSTGTRLAWATFTGESASGWQHVTFSTPVSITANTVYIASYHCPAGHYSADERYFATSGVNNPPLRALANGGSGGNGVYRYGPAGTFPNQTWNSANYWVDVMFEPTLNSIAVTPANPSISSGSTQLFTATGSYADGSTRNITSRVTWTSSNTSVATIGSGGVATAAGAGTTTIRAASGSVSGTSSLTVTVQPLAITTASLPGGSINEAYSATLTASGGTLPRAWSVSSGSLPPGLTLNAGSGAISGTPGASGTFNFAVQVSDASTPSQTVTKALSIAVAPSPSNFASIWPATAVPTNPDGGPDSPVELGVKFRSDVAGVITGIRFYKAASNTGTHVGSLWSSTGTRLAWATFTEESASGWQQVTFSTPVSITANTVYVASYHCPAGHYSSDENYFATSGVDNPPLHLLANGVSGGNGVYRYGPAGTFPNQAWNAANYWVDVMFEQTSGSDTLRPTVVATTPRSGASGVSTAGVVTVTFSEEINSSTLNTTTLSLLNEANQAVPATVAYNSATRTATLTPNAPLEIGSTYLAVVKGGASGVADPAGNRLAADVLWSFTAATYGALTGGPGGPVLVITDESQPLSQYYAEILLAEGLNHFAIKDISDVSASTLGSVDVVVLGAITLTNAQVTMFTNWVNQGGNLIAMRPDKKLANLLGLMDTGTTLPNSYLRANTSSGPGAGIVGEAIQYHGAADRYTLASAISVATLCNYDQTPTANPAVTLREVGTNGGQAAAFTFDLASSVVMSRQGNPAWVNQERDGHAPVRSSDLFYGAASSDPQPDWIDLRKVAIPQADEQQRLLANLITVMSADRNLLPRFWYFPHGHEAAVVMTGDDHAKNGTKGRFDSELALSDENGSLDDWETIRSTSYIYINGNAMSDAQAAAYTAAGFELGLHLNTGCQNYTRESLDTFFSQQLDQWRARYPSLTSPATHRVHCLVWNGYTTLPEIEAKHGIRLDVNYYFWPPEWVANRPGFMTGSGMPMRFATLEGNVIDVYQAATQMTDESGQAYPFTINQLLDKALGSEGFYGAFVANMHTDEASTSDYTSLVLAAIDRGVPVITARQLLTWTDARNSSSITQLQSTAQATTFTVNTGAAAQGLQVMVPLPAGEVISSVSYNGQNIPFQLRVIKGIQYAFLDARKGNYEIRFAVDSTAPTVTSVVPAAGATGIQNNTSISVTFSEPVNTATLTTSNLILRDPSNVTVSTEISYSSSNNTATLTPAASLRVGTAYTLTVRGGSGGVADVAGNLLASNFVSTFTTASSSVTTHSIWPDTATPAVLADGDRKAVELGVKFRTTVAGRIKGIRFYKSSNNTGVHVGNLWTQNGTPMGSLVFSNESASGWQYQEFSSPIPVSANTTYVASYHTTVGRYSFTNGYFNTAFENGPLRALSSTEGGGNGVYRYGSSGFPNQTFNATNYWVDVVFESN